MAGMKPDQGGNMVRRGEIVHQVGEYKVYEMVETFLNNKTQVQSYSVVGPKSDSSWLHSLESAVKAANDLSAAK